MTNTGLDTRITLNTMCSGPGERVLSFKESFHRLSELVRLDCEVSGHLGLFLIRFHYRLHRGPVSKGVVDTERGQLGPTRNGRHTSLRNELAAASRLPFQSWLRKPDEW